MAVETLPSAAEVTNGTQTNADQKTDFASWLNFLLAKFGSKSGQGPQTVASAATLDLDAVVETRDIAISGAVAITAVTIEAGKVFRARASGAFTLTNNANIVTNTGANIVCAAGDSFVLRATAANTVEIILFTRAGVIPQANGGTGTALTSRPVLQCLRQQTGGEDDDVAPVIPFDNTLPTKSEGFECMTLAFTPKSASSLIVVEALLNVSCNQASAHLIGALFKDTSCQSVGCQFMASATGVVQLKMSISFTSGSTTAFTLSVNAGNSVGGTTTVNGQASVGLFGGALVSSITATEYL